MTAATLGALDLLRALIEASGLRGDPRNLATAAPHMSTRLSGADYIRTLRNLDLDVVVVRSRLSRIETADCPFLFVPDDGAPFVVTELRGGRALALVEGRVAGTWRDIDDLKGAAVSIAEGRSARDDARNPMSSLGGNLRATATGLLVASCFSNLFAFATPLLIMTIYDRVIPASSYDLILSLSVAMALVFASDFGIRTIRARSVSEAGAALERDLGLALFRKLSLVPLAQIEASGVQRQLARLRQFEGMREVFTGPILSSILDLPFVLIFLIAAFAISPMIGLLVLGIGALFLVAAALTLPILRARGAASAESRAALQRHLFEVATKRADIQRLGAEAWWRDRIAQHADVAARDARRAKQAQLAVTTFGQSLMAFAGVATVAIGAEAALSGVITFGGLIALMAIVWRILGPIQALFANASKIDASLRSRDQVERVLALKEEFVRGVEASRMKAFRGAIEFDAVSHRFRAEDEPALSNVSFSVAPGELVMVCGDSGSGKSTLLNMIAKIYTPTAGRIRVDGVDYRQIAVDDLRNAVGYVRQKLEFFYGTIAQNLRLAHPAATDAELRDALRDAGVLDDVDALPEGLETRMNERFQARMSKAFAKSFALARGFCSGGDILLFDEPCRGLHPDKERLFFDAIERRRGQRTIFVVTERTEHLRHADRVLFLEKGRLLVDDSGRSAVKKVEALFAQRKGSKQ